MGRSAFEILNGWLPSRFSAVRICSDGLTVPGGTIRFDLRTKIKPIWLAWSKCLVSSETHEEIDQRQERL